MRVNLFNNGQKCSVGKAAGLFKWIVMPCNNLNYEVSLISSVRTKLLILCVHYKIYPLYLPFWLLNRRDDSAGTRSMVLALSPCLFHVFFSVFFLNTCVCV